MVDKDKIKKMIDIINDNETEINLLNIKYKQYNAFLPSILEDYSEKSIVKYLLGIGFSLADEKFETYKNKILLNYKKRQNVLNSKDRLIVLNLMLSMIINFYERKTRLPNWNEVIEMSNILKDTDNKEYALNFVKREKFYDRNS